MITASVMKELMSNGSASVSKVSKLHYITKAIHETLIGNSRFLIQSLLKQLLCYTGNTKNI